MPSVVSLPPNKSSSSRILPPGSRLVSKIASGGSENHEDPLKSLQTTLTQLSYQAKGG
jgi:hypothetical protein